MYAIIREGGKQHHVEEGQVLLIDRQGLKPGEEVEFADVLLYRDDNVVEVGTPTVPNVRVVASVKGPTKGEKVISVQYRRRKFSRRKVGHRQKYTEVVITKIVASK